jgi:hypothetical protein
MLTLKWIMLSWLHIYPREADNEIFNYESCYKPDSTGKIARRKCGCLLKIMDIELADMHQRVKKIQ